jgi:hypothetical protein
MCMYGNIEMTTPSPGMNRRPTTTTENRLIAITIQSESRRLTLLPCDKFRFTAGLGRTESRRLP